MARTTRNRPTANAPTSRPRGLRALARRRRSKYGAHKPSSKESKILELIEAGADIAVLSEQEMIEIFLPTLGESTHMLREDPERWNRWRQRFKLPSGGYPAQLRGIDLEDADLTAVDLQNVHLHEANLRGANLSGCPLGDTEFTGADLTGANLSGVGAYRARFSRAILRDANLARGDFTWCKFDDADLTGANLDGATLLHADFTQCVKPDEVPAS